MTSNIASDKIMEFKEPKERERAVHSELKRYFKPEFLNRLDDIVIFGPLDLDAITEIVIFYLIYPKELGQRGVWKLFS